MKLATVQAYSVVMFFASMLVIATGVILWLIYDPGVPDSFGLRTSMTELIISSMLPLAVVNLTGFREVAFETIVSLGGDNKPRIIPIKSGATFLYIVGLIGIFSFLICMLIVSIGIETGKAKILIVFAASTWGLTTGVIFPKYFKQFASGHRSGA